MRITFVPVGWQDYTHWQSADRNILKKINRLVHDIMRDPFEGIGKPAPLRHTLAGAWSRRITDEHRLVYLVEENDVVILQARYHYNRSAP